MTRCAVVEAPSILGLRPTGVETLPEALLEAGLAERLGARRAGRVDAPPYNARRDPTSLLLNPRAIAEYAVKLANAVGRVLDAGEFPLVLGGDCSIVLGNTLALRRRGRYGLLFVDGHADFYQPEANTNGEAASSDLALATGRGPSVVTAIEGYCPLVRDEDVVVFGFRDAEEAASYGSQPLPRAICAFDLAAVHRLGVATAIHRALGHLVRDDLAGFWVHLDADVLDDAVMPAVDYRLPGGLSFDELAETLSAAVTSGRAIGFDVTIYNPRLDPTRVAARGLMNALVRGLGYDHGVQSS